MSFVLPENDITQKILQANAKVLRSKSIFFLTKEHPSVEIVFPEIHPIPRLQLYHGAYL